MAPANVDPIDGQVEMDRDRSFSAPSPILAKKPPVPPKPGTSTPSSPVAPFPIVRQRNGSAGSSDSGEPYVYRTPSGRGPPPELKKTQSFTVQSAGGDGPASGKKMIKRTPTFTTRRQHSLKKACDHCMAALTNFFHPRFDFFRLENGMKCSRSRRMDIWNASRICRTAASGRRFDRGKISIRSCVGS